MSKKIISLKLTQREFQAILCAAGSWLDDLDEYKANNNGKCSTFWTIMYDDLKNGYHKGVKQYDKNRKENN